MKRIILSLLLAGVLLLSGCAANAQNGAVPSGTADPKQESVYGKLSGCYRGTKPETEEGREQYIKVCELGGLVLIDCVDTFDDEVESFWAREIWPSDMTAPAATSANELRGFNQCFSYFSNDGAYWDGSMDVIVALTENGLTLTDTSGDYAYESAFERLSEDCPFFSSPQEMEVGLPAEVSRPEELFGKWCAAEDEYAVCLSLEADGTLAYALKEKGTPVAALFGIWGVDENGFLRVSAERLGNGKIPLSFELAYSTDKDAMRLMDTGGDIMVFPLPPVIEPCLTRAQEDWRFPESLL